jgi:thioredoxin reductase
MSSAAPVYDVIVVGGGPAGLNAALVLGRCRRRVLLFDNGSPRNARAAALHGFLSRDGIPPLELLRIGREELRPYGVDVVNDDVATAHRLESGPDSSTAFAVTTTTGKEYASRKLLLATGLTDELPAIEGARTFYGRGVYHCPYCDAWEHRDRHLAAYGAGRDAVGLALSLKTWSGHVTACTDGMEVEPEDRDRLRRNGIVLRTEHIVRLEGTTGPEGLLEHIVFDTGPVLECAALFFNTKHFQHSSLPEQLGCSFADRNEVRTRRSQYSGIQGLYLAGDADGDVQFAIVAAAEGAIAAVAINHELQQEQIKD